MDQGEQTWSEAAQVTGPRIWRTTEVDTSEAFDYYHEGICSAFMPLRPSLDRSHRHGFQATHYAYGIGASTLNLVSAQSHLVQRGRAEIAASTEDCYYLNFQLAGDCRITQNGTGILLLPGDVGLFDSSQSFGLHHDSFPELKVASLMLPKHSIGGNGGDQPARTPELLSRHPVYGRLIAEAMQSLVETTTTGNPADVMALQSLVISMLKLTAPPPGAQANSLPSTGNGSPADSVRGQAQLLRIKRIIHTRCTTPGYSAAACASEAGLSARYIHRLFETDDDSFGTFLIHERLAAATRMLRHPNSAHPSTATIATESGFSDPSHFHRAFRSRYGMTPGDWRRWR